MQTFLRKSLIVSAIALGAAVVGQNASADPGDNFSWQTVIGIAAPNGVVGSGTGAITGAPGPWSALGGKVRVDPDTGKIDFTVDGLVFASGPFIGNRGPVAQVKGTLVCDTDGSASPTHDSVIVETPSVDLDEEGDARFHGFVPAVPAVCVTEPDIAFLIRATSNGKWIGNGAVLR